MKISFLGLGVQKAGTSTLHDILKHHSDIYLPEANKEQYEIFLDSIKELHFFDLSENYSRGVEWLKSNFFINYENQQAVGEFTPDYFYVDTVPQRIAETLGTDTKFIVIFRNPVNRAISHYNMNYRRGIDRLDFFEAIKNEAERIKPSEMDNIKFSYMNRGLYSVQLKRFLAIFPVENFLFLVFENDIVKNLPHTINRIQSFLNVKSEELNINVNSNEAFEPYSIKLNRLMHHKMVKKVGSSLFPLSLRLFIKRKIFGLKKKQGSNQLFSLTDTQMQSLFESYFLPDVKILESLTKINFNDIWYSDNA